MTLMTQRPARTLRPERETPEVAAGALRMVRAVGRRASSDVDALPLLAQIAAEVEEQLVIAVHACRQPRDNGQPGWSWADVGRVLGISKQAAQQRFGRAGDA